MQNDQKNNVYIQKILLVIKKHLQVISSEGILLLDLFYIKNKK